MPAHTTKLVGGRMRSAIIPAKPKLIVEPQICVPPLEYQMLMLWFARVSWLIPSQFSAQSHLLGPWSGLWWRLLGYRMQPTLAGSQHPSTAHHLLSPWENKCSQVSSRSQRRGCGRSTSDPCLPVSQAWFPWNKCELKSEFAAVLPCALDTPNRTAVNSFLVNFLYWVYKEKGFFVCWFLWLTVFIALI